MLTFITPRETPSLLEERVAELGEPWLSAFTPEAMELLLRIAGFSQVDLLTSEMAAEYFLHRPDDLPAPTHPGIATAVR